jgi:hypothetical protein
MTLHRFKKLAGEDQMVIDILVSGAERVTEVIDNAMEAESPGTGKVKVATKEELVWMKQQRNSAQDQVDIQSLQNEGT